MNGFLKRTLRTSRRNDLGFGMLIIRLGLAYTMIFGHGYPKLLRFESLLENFADPIGLGVAASVVLVVFAEFFCSILIGLGLFTRLAAIPLIVTMWVATFVVNFTKGFGVFENGLIYLIVYVGILFIGPGKFSFDGRMTRR